MAVVSGGIDAVKVVASPSFETNHKTRYQLKSVQTIKIQTASFKITMTMTQLEKLYIP